MRRPYGKSARLDNFRHAAVWAGRHRHSIRSRGAQGKGQQQEIASFVDAVRAGALMPIPAEALAATTRATLAVGASLLSGRPEQV